MGGCRVKYVVKYANGQYLGNGRRSRMVKSKGAATRYDTEEEARARARARATIQHTREDLQHYVVEVYTERGPKLKGAKPKISDDAEQVHQRSEGLRLT